MGHAAPWGRPLEFQLANWTASEPAASQAWAPPGLPVEYVSIDIFGNCNLQAHVPESSGGQQQQLVESYYCSAANLNGPSERAQVSQLSSEAIDGQNRVTTESYSKSVGLQISNDSRASGVFEQVSSEFEGDVKLMKKKMHRYPASLRAHLDESSTVPRYVAIGPYHHGRDHLKQAEKVKHVAAIQCVMESGRLLEDLYEALVPVADNVRRLYDKDVMAGIGYDDFRHMMFFDACFLVQYMLMRSDKQIDKSLRDLFSPNSIDIRHDITLLENQVPWKVLKTIMVFRPVPLERFIYKFKNYLQDQNRSRSEDLPTLEKSYKPPHLLGLLRHYIVGSNDATRPLLKPKKRSVSISAMELAEIGITLTANKTMELMDMGLNREWTLFAELSLAPLSLDRDRASYLVNMAALELCTVKSFFKAPVEDSVVCSYLLLLAILVYREEDVHELRARGILQGGGGLTNEEALRFFTSLQGPRFGRSYNRIMRDIEIYKEKRRMQIKLYAFFYNNKKIIAAVVTAIGAVGGIIGTLLSIKKSI